MLTRAQILVAGLVMCLLSACSYLTPGSAECLTNNDCPSGWVCGQAFRCVAAPDAGVQAEPVPDAGPSLDAGVEMDAGTVPASDGGVDAGTDAGVPGAPAGVTVTSMVDAAVVMWSGPTSGSPIASWVVTPSTGSGSLPSKTLPAATTSETFDNLTGGATYVFAVQACNPVGCGPSASSSPTVIESLAGPPTGVTAVSGNGTMTVTWTAPANRGTGTITGYQITANDGTQATTTGTGTMGQVTGLTIGTSYAFTVAAITTAGVGAASQASSPVVQAAAPGAPGNVTASAGIGAATITWTTAVDNASPITAYVVTPVQGSTPGTQVSTDGASTSTIVTGLTSGASYTFQVAAVNGIGTGPIGTSPAVTTEAVPGPPTNVTAMASGSTVTISWTPPADDGGSAITGYEVLSGASLAGMTQDGMTTSVTLSPPFVMLGETSIFTVAAINVIGAGAESTPLSFLDVIAPTAPLLVAAALTSTADQVLVSWAPPRLGRSSITGYTVTISGGQAAVSPVMVPGSAMQATVSGLTGGVTYTFDVVATNSVGTSPPGTATQTVAVAPSAPVNVTATAGPHSVTVTWGAPADGGSPITGYVVTPYKGTKAEASTTAAAGTTQVTITGLAGGTTYTFVVVAKSAYGTSPPAAAEAVTTPAVPGAPTGVMVANTVSGVAVSWMPPSSDGGSPITGYEIFNGTTLLAMAAGTGTSTTLTSPMVTGGTTYQISVAAVNAVGTGSTSAPVSFLDIEPPGAPVSVTATLTATQGQVLVSWTAPSSTADNTPTGFTVSASFANGTPSSQRSTTNGSATQVDVTGLSVGSTYTFSVTSTNAAGSSRAVTSAPVFIPGPPTAPMDVTATGGVESVTVTWSAPTSDGGSAITGYTVTPCFGSIAGAPVSVDASTTQTTITGLAEGTTYTVEVTATSANGTGPVGTSAPVTTEGVPGAPTGVTAALMSGGVVVSWTAPTSDGGTAITGYTVTAGGNVVATVDGTTTSTLLEALTLDTTYTFEVYATNALGNGPTGTSGPILYLTVPSVLQNVSVSDVDATDLAVSWTAPAADGDSPITGYVIDVTGGAGSIPPVMASATATSATLSGLVTGTTYTIEVTAENSVGLGPSVTVMGTPTDIPDPPTDVSAIPGLESATVSWMPPDNAEGADITGYVITPCVGSAIDAGPGATQTLITGLPDGTMCTITVGAIGTAGPGVAASVTVTTPLAGAPGPVQSPSATVGIASATVSWTAPTITGDSAIVSYTVTALEGSTPGAPVTVDGTIMEATITGLANAMSYDFEIVATNEQGAGATALTGTVSTPGPPSAPTQLQVTGGVEAIDVSWTPTQDDDYPITGYVVTVSTSGTVMTTVTEPAAAVSAAIGDLPAGASYTVSVAETNSIGTGPAAMSSSVWLGAPSAPADVEAGIGTTLSQISWSPPSNDGSISNYTITALEGVTVAASVTVDGSQTSGVVTGLMPATMYTIEVVATSALGTSPAATTTLITLPTNSDIAPCAALLPGTPSPIVLTAPVYGVPTTMTVPSNASMASVVSGEWAANAYGGAPTGSIGATDNGWIAVYVNNNTDSPMPLGVSAFLGNETSPFSAALSVCIEYSCDMYRTGSIDVISNQSEGSSSIILEFAFVLSDTTGQTATGCAIEQWNTAQ